MNERMLLEDGLKQLSLSFSPQAVEKLLRFSDLLLEKNRVMNLTAIEDPAEIAALHFLDSAALLTLADFRNKRVADVGTGAGFPGLPLRILEPSLSLTLLDAQNKRVEFLKEVCAALGLSDVTCVHARAEEFAADHREGFDLVVSRAVANLRLLAELCLPLVKEGGRFLAMKSVDSDQELAESRHAIETLGGAVETASSYVIPGTEIRHRVIFIKKLRKTDKKYPRTFAKIKKHPL